MKMKKGAPNPEQESSEKKIPFDELAFQLGIEQDHLDYFLERVDQNLHELGISLERKDAAMLLELIEMLVENRSDPESAIDQANRLAAYLSLPSNRAAADAMEVPLTRILSAQSNLARAMARAYRRSLMPEAKDLDEWVPDRVERFLGRVNLYTRSKNVDASSDMLTGLIYEIKNKPGTIKDEVWQSDLDFLNDYLTNSLPPKGEKKGLKADYLNDPRLKRLAYGMASRFDTVSNARVDPNNFSPYEVKKFQLTIDPDGEFFDDSLTEDDIHKLMNDYKNNQLRKTRNKNILSKLNKETSAFLLYLSGVRAEIISERFGMRTKRLAVKIRVGIRDELGRPPEPEGQVGDIVLDQPPELPVSPPKKEVSTVQASEEVMPIKPEEPPAVTIVQPVIKNEALQQRRQHQAPQPKKRPSTKETKEWQDPRKHVVSLISKLVEMKYLPQTHAEILKHHLDIENKVGPTRQKDTVAVRRIETFELMEQLLLQQNSAEQTTRKIHQMRVVRRLFGSRRHAIAPVSRQDFINDYKQKIEQEVRRTSGSPEEISQKLRQFVQFLDISLAELLDEAITRQDR